MKLTSSSLLPGAPGDTAAASNCWVQAPKDAHTTSCIVATMPGAARARHRPRRAASLGQPYRRSTSRPRGLEASSGLGRARRLAGSLSRPTRARPRTQNPSRARVARCELAHDSRLERRRPAVHWPRSRPRSRLLAIAESRASGNSRPAAASARGRPRKVDAAPAAVCHAACIDPQAPMQDGRDARSAHRPRREPEGTHAPSPRARARAHGHTGEPLAHWHLTPCPQRTAPKRPARAALRRPRRRSDRRPVLSVVRRSLVQVLRLVSEDAVSASRSAARARSAGRCGRRRRAIKTLVASGYRPAPETPAHTLGSK